jgi:hypothetical protein
MTMAEQITLVCDLCKSTTQVYPLVFSRHGDKSWQIDVCDSCYAHNTHIGKLREKGRPSVKVAGRPQAKFKMTELPPQP